MEITEVKIFLNRENTNRLRARANILIDGCFLVRNLKVIEGEDGYFVAMPNIRRGPKIQDIAHPVDNETRIMIENKVLDKYEEVLDARFNKQQPEITYGRR